MITKNGWEKSENHKGAKISPLYGWFRSFSCINEEDDDQVINLMHYDGGSEGTAITIDSVYQFLGGFKTAIRLKKNI